MNAATRQPGSVPAEPKAIAVGVSGYRPHMSESPSAPAPASLTEEEARVRSALIEVERYDITVDVRELMDGERWLASSTVTFTCHHPGATTFVDVVGEVVSARLNDVELDV